MCVGAAGFPTAPSEHEGILQKKITYSWAQTHSRREFLWGICERISTRVRGITTLELLIRGKMRG